MTCFRHNRSVALIVWLTIWIYRTTLFHLLAIVSVLYHLSCFSCGYLSWFVVSSVMFRFLWRRIWHLKTYIAWSRESFFASCIRTSAVYLKQVNMQVIIWMSGWQTRFPLAFYTYHLTEDVGRSVLYVVFHPHNPYNPFPSILALPNGRPQSLCPLAMTWFESLWPTTFYSSSGSLCCKSQKLWILPILQYYRKRIRNTNTNHDKDYTRPIERPVPIQLYLIVLKTWPCLRFSSLVIDGFAVSASAINKLPRS